MLYRRPASALLDAIYREKRSWRPQDVRGTPWRVKEELVLCAVIAPSLRTDIRAQPAPYLFTSDASMVAGEITRAEIPEHIARQLHFWSDTRGERAWLKPQSVTVRDKGGHATARLLTATEENFSDPVPSLAHTDVRHYRFRKVQHINILENSVVTSLVMLLANAPEC